VALSRDEAEEMRLLFLALVARSIAVNTYNLSSEFIETTGNIDNRRQENIKNSTVLKIISIRGYSEKNINNRNTYLSKIKMLLPQPQYI
jgi:hypothetical protein